MTLAIEHRTILFKFKFNIIKESFILYYIYYIKFFNLI